jgi:hypothetical protein
MPLIICSQMFTRNHKITALPCTIFQTPFKSPFGSQPQPFDYKEKQFIIYWVPPIFCVGYAAFTKQELHAFFALFT